LDGGPVSVGQAIEGDIGAEVELGPWAEITAEAAVKARTVRSDGRIIFQESNAALAFF
jgi:hypothetical protein